MKKPHKTRQMSKPGRTDREGSSTEVIAQRTRMSLDLLQQLACAVAANEKIQQRFRTAVLIRVSRIEATVKLIHGAQIADAHNCVDSKEMTQHAKASDEFIAKDSNELGLAMVKYIYGHSDEKGLRRDGRRKWSDWEI
jgi:hypothetical protein